VVADQGKRKEIHTMTEKTQEYTFLAKHCVKFIYAAIALVLGLTLTHEVVPESTWMEYDLDSFSTLGVYTAILMVLVSIVGLMKMFTEHGRKKCNKADTDYEKQIEKGTENPQEKDPIR